MTRFIHLLAVLILILPAGGAFAQSVDSLFAPIPASMGQPDRLRFNWGLGAGYDFDTDAAEVRVNLDLSTYGLLVPQVGIGAITAEAGLGFADDAFESALGAYFCVPWLRAGAEYNFEREKVSPSFSFEFAPVRGGIFRHGDALRIDYRPIFGELQLGVVFVSPFKRYRRTRPVHRYTRLPDGALPRKDIEAFAGVEAAEHGEMEEVLAQIEHAMTWMDRLLTPRFRPGKNFSGSAEGYRGHIQRAGHTFNQEDARYHRLLDRAFTLVADGDRSAGTSLAAAAERVIFEKILVPYNGLFGQNKKPRTPKGFIEAAVVSFDVAIGQHAATLDSAERRRAAREVFRRVAATIEEVADRARRRWYQQHIFWLRQGRLVWLPLNYGLRPEQCDTQREVDDIVAALTHQRFTDANHVEYVLNQEFHNELKRMIRETSRYHVFVIHDIRGRYGKNVTDTIGWDVVVDGYIRAFLEAIREIDNGERTRLPQFIVYLDENFYQDNKSRGIVTYLENLYDPPSLDLSDDAVEGRVVAAQKRLRTAITDSPTLAGVGEDRLREAFRIHVSVTNPYDPIFAADAVMRDHRKLTFRDVFEDDPSSGVGILTGQGVGEHYNGPSWEDRSMLVRGPALVALKSAARRLHLSQGYADDEVPAYLRARDFPDDYEKRCAALQERGWRTPLLTAFNETGYGDKKATVLKAVLYNLANRRRVVFSMDSLWISDFWAGMFISAALRGAHMFPIAPAAENAPSSALPTMFLMRENLDIMVQARNYFAAEIEQAEGSLHVGLYAHDTPVDDIKRRVDRFLDGISKYPFLQEHLKLHPSVIEMLRAIHDEYDRQQAALDKSAVREFELSSEHKPFIHLKAQLLTSFEALKVIELEEWAPILRKYVEIRRKQVNGLPNEGITPALLRIREGGADDLHGAFKKRIAASEDFEWERAVYLLTIGSHNQDRRGMLLDGEALLAVAGLDAMIALADLMFIVGTAEWPRTSEELITLFPKGDLGLIARASRWIKDLI